MEFLKQNLNQYSESSFKNSARTIKADLEAFSINKEASVITMKSKDFIYF